MKKIFTFLSLICLVFLVGCSKPTEPDVKTEIEEEKSVAEVVSHRDFKILTIGNSFTDDVIKYLYPILKGFGVQNIEIASLVLEDADINTHITNGASNTLVYRYRKIVDGKQKDTAKMGFKTALLDEEWQYVTIQQKPGLSGDINSYDTMVGALADYVRQVVNNDKVKVGWNMTWAYADNSKAADFALYGNSQIQMYASILECINKKIVKDKSIDFIVPCGTAIQNARTSYLGDTLNSNGQNLEDLGQLIAGLTYVMKITGWNFSDFNVKTLPKKFIPYMPVVEESVNNAMSDGLNVTQSEYSINPVTSVKAETYDTKLNVQYSDVSTKCKLDMYLPRTKEMDIVVHFHGGGLNSGDKADGAHKSISAKVAGRGVGFVSVNYRMYPSAKYPDFFNDAAAAVKYVKDYMTSNGIKGNLYVSGQSAGAYISMMLAFNRDYLKNAGMSVNDVYGWFIESGQPTTHFNVLGEKNLNTKLERIDEGAPMYYVNTSTSFNNMLLMAYTDDIVCRLEENQLLYRSLLNFNAKADVTLEILEGQHCVNSTTAYRGHYPYVDMLLEFIESTK